MSTPDDFQIGDEVRFRAFSGGFSFEVVDVATALNVEGRNTYIPIAVLSRIAPGATPVEARRWTAPFEALTLVNRPTPRPLGYET